LPGGSTQCCIKGTSLGVRSAASKKPAHHSEYAVLHQRDWHIIWSTQCCIKGTSFGVRSAASKGHHSEYVVLHERDRHTIRRRLPASSWREQFQVHQGPQATPSWPQEARRQPIALPARPPGMPYLDAPLGHTRTSQEATRHAPDMPIDPPCMVDKLAIARIYLGARCAAAAPPAA